MADLFSGSFETGDTSQFTSASGTVQSSVVYGGSYAGANTDNTNFYKVLQRGTNPSYIHGMFRWSVDVSAAASWFVLLGYGEASDQFYMQLLNGVLKITINATNDSYTGHTVLAANTWYSIEVYYYMHASSGAIEVRINGVTEIAQSLINTKNGTDTGIMKAKWQGINASGTCYVDDCSMDDTTWNYRKITMRVSLPGYNALTDGVVDHYSIFADTDNVLIKELTRGTISVAASSSGTVTHNLGYVPASAAWFLKAGESAYHWCNDSQYLSIFMHPGTANILFSNNYGTPVTFYYYIFYDQAA